MIIPPINWNRLRKPIEMELPTTVWTSVVSPVSRDSTSPVCNVSKNCGGLRQHSFIHRDTQIRRDPFAYPAHGVKAR